MFKKALPLILILTLSFTLSFQAAHQRGMAVSRESTRVKYPGVEAASGILIDGSDGKVLWSLNPDERRPMASTTKIMTALIALERLNLDRKIEAGRAAAGVDGSGLGIEVGERLTVRELIYSMMLKSANDAAVAVAEGVAGSVPAFAELMNKKAQELNLNNTHFMNPHGLDQAGHYSTARDLAILARAVLERPELAEIVATKEWSFRRRAGTEVLKNRNQLIGSYPYATGVKTGHTEKAGYCLVASAKKGSVRLISVVLGAPSEESAAAISKDVLEYGFSLYRERLVVDKGRVFKSVELPYGRSFNLVAQVGLKAVVRRDDEITFKVEENPSIAPPVKPGSKYGKLIVYKNGEKIGKIPLVADREVKPLTFAEWMYLKTRSLWEAIVRLGDRLWNRFSLIFDGSLQQTTMNSTLSSRKT